MIILLNQQAHYKQTLQAKGKKHLQRTSTSKKPFWVHRQRMRCCTASWSTEAIHQTSITLISIQFFAQKTFSTKIINKLIHHNYLQDFIKVCAQFLIKILSKPVTSENSMFFKNQLAQQNLNYFRGEFEQHNGISYQVYKQLRYILQLVIGVYSNIIFYGQQFCECCLGPPGSVHAVVDDWGSSDGDFDLKINYDWCIIKLKSVMNFSRTPLPELRQTPLSFGQVLSKTPLPRREYRFETAEGEAAQYRVRVNASFLSPPPHPIRQNAPFRPLSPLPTPYRIHCNPETPNGQTTRLEFRDAPFQISMNNKSHKNSESCVGMNWGSNEVNGCMSKEQAGLLNAPKMGRKMEDKYRKKSCHMEPTIFLKSRKQSSNEEVLTTSRISMAEPTKGKRKGWDETNNFHLSTNYNSEQNSTDLTQSQIEYPRSNARKHSDNFYLKKVPSFLTTPKAYRKSFDTCESQKPKGLSIQNFMIAKQLGRGAFGRVVLAIQRRTGLVCAIKIMSKREILQSSMQEQLVRQLKIQLFINHPNVVKVYGFFDDLLHFYTVMECALDGHLSDHISRRPTPIKQEEVSVLLYQTCAAVAALHTHSIIHRDLKPENLLMHDGIVKLSDFGWSVNRGSELRTTFCGTPIYLCPEILVGDEYDQSVDIWTIGIILYEMLYRNNPFGINTQQDLPNIINSPVFFDDSQVSQPAKEVVRACLAKKAIDRPNIRELMLYEFVIRGQTADQLKR